MQRDTTTRIAASLFLNISTVLSRLAHRLLRRDWVRRLMVGFGGDSRLTFNGCGKSWRSENRHQVL
jgi:hypothetical protein